MAFANKDKKKPLFWTYDPTSKKAKDDVVALSSKTFFDCIENMEKIGDKYEADQMKKLGNAP